jgi:hypothetical protein
VGVVYLFSSSVVFFQNQNLYIFIAVIFALIYLLFAISNTMFSSKVDMEGTLEILIAILIILGAVYLLGFRPPLGALNKIFTKDFIGVIQKSVIFLFAPIAIDLFILGMIRLLTGSQSRI